MARAIFKVFFTIIVAITGAIVAPINALVVNLFPDLSRIISTFNSIVTNYIAPGVSWFFAIIPSTARTLTILYLTILLGYYGISITVHGIIKAYEIIKKIKFW